MRIGVFPGTTAKNILSAILRTNCQMDADDVVWVFLPPNVQLDALRSKDIDTLYTYETVRTLAELSGMRRLFGSVVAEVLDGAPYGCSAINTKFAHEHINTALDFIRVFDEAVVEVREDRPRVRLVLEENLGVSAAVAQRCNLEPRLTSQEIVVPRNVARFQSFLMKLVEVGEMTSEIDGGILLWRQANERR
jgi:ABC-type nitrate/sulfonate/bicarbonate transport system substrate-binding protein